MELLEPKYSPYGTANMRVPLCHAAYVIHATNRVSSLWSSHIILICPLLTKATLAREECTADFSNISTARPSSINALGAMFEFGVLVTIEPTIT